MNIRKSWPGSAGGFILSCSSCPGSPGSDKCGVVSWGDDGIRCKEFDEGMIGDDSDDEEGDQVEVLFYHRCASIYRLA